MAAKHAKFDSYLKRTLEEKVYEQVRVSDPCIVQGQNVKHGFRFAFLTDEAIYVTENPPKAILFTVPFCDLRDVQLVHDTPKFLQKELQAIVQHVLIKYVTNEEPAPPNRSYRRLSSITPSSYSLRNFLNSLLHFKRPSMSSGKASPSTSRKASVSTDSPTDGSSTSSSVERRQSHSRDKNSTHPRKTSTGSGILSHLFSGRRESSKLSAISFSDSGSGVNGFGSRKGSTSSRDSSGWSPGDPMKIEIVEHTALNGIDLHLYILDDASIFFMMLKVVWRAYVLKSTLQADEHRNSVSAATFSYRNLTPALLSELKKDILDGYQQSLLLEFIYKYFHELKSVVADNITVKAFFWKDPQLFTVCGDYLTKYSSSESVVHSKRTDEIECMVLVCETLSEALRQTEALTSCDRVLQKSCGSPFYSNFIKFLVEKPKIPSTLERDGELNTMIQDYRIAACDVLYELIAIAEQVSWNSEELLKPFFTPSYLFSLLDLQPGLVSFLKNVFMFCVKLWSSAPKTTQLSVPSTSVAPTVPPEPAVDSLSAADVVKIYRCFTVLHRCLGKCKQGKLAKLVFKDEFKYYIRPESLKIKIPICYPACGITRNIVSAVGSCVVDDEHYSFNGLKDNEAHSEGFAKSASSL